MGPRLTQERLLSEFYRLKVPKAAVGVKVLKVGVEGLALRVFGGFELKGLQGLGGLGVWVYLEKFRVKVQRFRGTPGSQVCPSLP